MFGVFSVSRRSWIAGRSAMLMVHSDALGWINLPIGGRL